MATFDRCWYRHMVLFPSPSHNCCQMRRTLALSIILLTSCSVTVPVRTTDRSLAVLAICSRVPYLAAAYDGSMTFQVNDAIQTRDSINALVDEVTGYFSYERR